MGMAGSRERQRSKLQGSLCLSCQRSSISTVSDHHGRIRHAQGCPKSPALGGGAKNEGHKIMISASSPSVISGGPVIILQLPVSCRRDACCRYLAASEALSAADGAGETTWDDGDVETCGCVLDCNR